MARPAKKDEHEDNGGITGEYQRPDAAKAIEIYDKQIKPKLTHINTLKGDLSEPWDTLKEQSRVPRTVFNFVQKLVDEDDDQKREHSLLALSELLIARGLTLPDDLVTRADGTAGASPVPTGTRSRPFLAAVDSGTPAVGTGAAAIAAMKRTNETDDFEMSEEELAGQADRRPAEETTIN